VFAQPMASRTARMPSARLLSFHTCAAARIGNEGRQLVWRKVNKTITMNYHTEFTVLTVENGQFLSWSFFYIMLLFSFLLNYEKLSDSINVNVTLHYFVVVYFHKCRKSQFRSDRFFTFMIPCSTFFNRFHP
jgi:hypothetical protein